jgi:hypothetical protein
MRRVLVNLLNGRDLWHGVETMNQGSGIPSVLTSLRKRGLIDHRNQLTRNGREAAEKATQ